METPLSMFIKKRMAEIPLTRKEAALGLGFQNPNTGYCNFDKWIRGQDTPRHQEDKLASAIQVSRKELDEAIAETEIAFANKRLMAEINYRNNARERFKPYICAMCTKRRPSPLFAGAFTQHLRFIYLNKEDLNLPYFEFKTLIQNKIQEHFAYNEGGVAAFGFIMHYVLYPDFDSPASEYMLFDVQGNRMSKKNKDIEIVHGVHTGLYIK